MSSPYQSPREPSPIKSRWITLGFFIGIGIFFLQIPCAFVIGPFSFLLGLLVAIGLAVANGRFGFITGYFAGLLLCIGLAVLALIIYCGPAGKFMRGPH